MAPHCREVSGNLRADLGLVIVFVCRDFLQMFALCSMNGLRVAVAMAIMGRN